jgi:hypothetical protein
MSDVPANPSGETPERGSVTPSEVAVEDEGTKSNKASNKASSGKGASDKGSKKRGK